MFSIVTTPLYELKMITRTRFGILIALLCATGAFAQQRRALSVEQAIQIGIENSKTLHTSMKKIEAANAHTSETNAALLPSLKLSAGYTRLSHVPDFTITPFQGAQPISVSSAILDNYNVQLNLQQPIFTGYKLEGSTHVAQHNADAAHLDYEKDRRDLVFNIRTAYWNLFKAVQVNAVIDSTINQTGAHLNDVQNLKTQGMATNNDVLKVQVQLSNVKFQQIDASNNVRMATMAINTLIGLPIDTEIDITSAAAMQSRTFADTHTLVQKAMDVRPDINAMSQRVKASEEAVSIARGGWYPQIFLVGNYTYAKPNARIFPARNEFDGTWSAGISASWDVWTWGTAGHQTTQAQAQLAQTEDALGLLKDGVTLEVNQNTLQLSKAKERISVAQEGVTQAEENLRVTNDKFKMGLVLNSEVLDAEVALQQSKTNYTQAIVDFELAQAALEKSVGE